jgi:hypothetical protein
MAQLVVAGPLDEADLHDDLGTHPVGAQARQPDGFGERRLLDLERVEPRAQLEQHLVSKPVPIFPAKTSSSPS